MNIKTIREKLHGKITKQSIKTFLKKQGLYVLIFLCLVAAGITALVAWPRDESKLQISDPDLPSSEGQGVVSEGDAIAVIEVPTVAEQNARDDAEDQAEIDDNDTEAIPSSKPVVNNGSGSLKLTKPVSGQVIQDFSADSLVFFASLNVWQTHNGIDIKADSGADVVAALSGTVADVYTNEADGGVVVISHSSSSKTVYAGLSDIGVAIGDKISAGQTIGKIGEIPKELDLSYHLHFEYIVDGSFKDPAKFF